MRVSSTLNRVTAPILYRTVTLRAGTTSPYATTCGRRVTARTSPNAVDNIELIKNVIIKSHPTHGTVDGLFQGSIDVDSVRVYSAALMAGGRCLQCPANPLVDEPDKPCQFIRMYRPKKLVLLGAQNDISSHDLHF
jgi:hypothetical protein